LTAERVLTDTATVTWDRATAGQIKANHAALTGDVTTSAGGVATTIANDVVTYAKMQNVSAASVVLGRGSAAGAGDPQEITLGTGLSMTGTVLAASASGSGTTIFNSGRLAFVSTTALEFKPFNGDRIKINGTVFAIPTTGIVGLANTGVFVNGVAGQSLAASTVYYVYAFNNSGTITADFSTTGHATSTTAGNEGTEIKSGDNTRSLIGMIRTNASAQFADSLTQRFVTNWFNRGNLLLTGANTAGASTGSTTAIELTSAARVEFLVWSGEGVFAGAFGVMNNTVAGALQYADLGLDNGTTGQFKQAIAIQVYAVGINVPIAGTVALAVTEGYHFLTPIAYCQASTFVVTYFWTSALIRG
jgi:hypothetical protein